MEIWNANRIAFQNHPRFKLKTMYEFENKLTAHEIVDNRINCTVGIAEPMWEQRQHSNHCTLADVNGVSVEWRVVNHQSKCTANQWMNIGKLAVALASIAYRNIFKQCTGK